jgi:hypothetical protein
MVLCPSSWDLRTNCGLPQLKIITVSGPAEMPVETPLTRLLPRLVSGVQRRETGAAR